jgi:uncharacterized protein (DUF1499 family)
MGRMMLIGWVLVALIMVGLGYIRLAPSDPEAWHQLPEFAENKDFKKGVMRIVQAAPAGLAQIDSIARSTPNTIVLAGSVEDGMITYVTRTPLFGFPDYTTIQQDGDDLKIYARLRFGRSDMGVNRKRIENWLTALQAR